MKKIFIFKITALLLAVLLFSAGISGCGKNYSGEKTFGFLELPEGWNSFSDPDVEAIAAGKVLQFSDSAGSSIIALSYEAAPKTDAQSAASACWTQMEEEHAQDIHGATVKLDGCTAYQVYGYYSDEDLMLVLWTFTDKDGGLHYVSAEGPLKDISAAVEIVEDTYSLD